MTDRRLQFGAASGIVSIGVGDASSRRVRASIVPTPFGCRFTLEAADEDADVTAGRRLRVAAERLVQLDVLAERALLRGQPVYKDVPAVLPSLDLLIEPGAAEGEGVRYPVGSLLRPLLTATRPEEPLFSYQRRGVAWLIGRRRALLADDMGLGKTLQTIAALRRLARTGAVAGALVVAPRTLVANWEKELAQWAPELAVTRVTPEGSRSEEVWRSRLGRAHVIITTYEQVRTPPDSLIERTPDLVIADEAHKLRNRSSQTNAGFRRLRPGRLWMLTGTPVERDAEDLASLLSLLEPARFSTDDAKLGQGALRSRARPYALRREKKDVLADLPPVLKIHEVVDLSDSQRAAYTQVVRRARKGEQNFLAVFNQLRMICDLDPVSGASSKLDRIEELLSSVAEAGEKAIIFSYTIDPLRVLLGRLGGLGLRGLLFTGEMSLNARSETLAEFQGSPDVVALLASSRLASEGLTLTDANNVFFVNRWWNPSNNQQAEDRVVRVGQTLPVNVYTFTCRHTVEDTLERILLEKGLTFDTLVKQLSAAPDELSELFTEPS